MSGDEGARGAAIGGGLTVVAYLVITLNDAIMKALVGTLPLGELLVARSIVCIAVLVLAAPFFGGPAAMRPRRWRGILLTTALMVPNLFLFPWALTYMPLTTALILVYISPVFVVLLAPAFSGERPGPRRIAAVLAGFAGAWIVVDPDLSAPEPAYLVPLAIAGLIAARDLVTRQVALAEHPLTISLVAYLAVLAGGGATAFAGDWRPLTAAEAGLIAAGGTLLAFGQTLAVWAFRFAMAPVVSTLKYSGVVWSIAISFVAWGILPGPRELTGAALIMASGVAIVLIRDRRLAAHATPVLSRRSRLARAFRGRE